MNVEFFVGSMRLWKSLECISFGVQVMHSRILETPSRFQHVQNRDISLRRGGAKTSADAFFIYAYIMHLYNGFTCWHVRVSFGTRGNPGGRFERSRWQA